jgi:DNA-binding CsgD family transcriptional regulator
MDKARFKLGEIEFTVDSYLALLIENDLTTPPLTIRQMEILKSINKGFSNDKIADIFFISRNTVKYHIRHIYSKVGVQSRKELEEKIKLFPEFATIY